MNKPVILSAIAVGVAVGGFAFSAQEEPAQDVAATSTIQPIAFRHDIHADSLQMDCMYCHFSAERSVDAGIPSVRLCMGCHSSVIGTTPAQQAEIAKVVDYFNRGEPIPWVRVYKISDHAHYPHMRHIKAGLTCQECHGPVETMGAIEERDRAWGGDNMGWCVSCHVERGASRDCTVCHY